MRTLALSVVLAALLFMVCGQAVGDGLTAQQIGKLNNIAPAAKAVGLGTKLDIALHGVPNTISMFWSGNNGHDVGVSSDGVLFGSLTPQALTKCFLSTHAYNALNGTASTLCITAITGGTAFTTDTTDANDADVDDVAALAVNVTVEDALYIGNASYKFARTDITISTAGDFIGVVTWEYWNGAWVALAGVTDGTTNMSAGAGTVSVTYTLPTDWVTCQVNSITGYWIRGRVSTDTSGGGELLTKVYTVVADADVTYTDDTTDANDADAGDVALLPLYPVQHDAVYFGKSQKFCKIKATYSQAMTVGAGVITVEYSKAASAWATLTCNDNTATWVTAAGTRWVSFVPPADWALQTVNSTSAYWVRFRLSTAGVTQQPLGTQLWVSDFTHGAGFPMPSTGTVTSLATTAQTVSGSTADSKYLLVNITKGTFDDYTWTKATNLDSGTLSLAVTANDGLVLVQCIEDASTEFANCNYVLGWR